MKFLILSIVLTYVSASAIYREGRNIVFQDPDSVILSGISGSRLVINRPRSERVLDIVVSGVDVQPFRFLIDELSCNVIVEEEDIRRLREFRLVEDFRQPRVLGDILRRYQGALDDNRFEELLRILEKSVKDGQICRVIYDLIRSLDRVNSKDVIDRIIEELRMSKRRISSLPYYDVLRGGYQRLLEVNRDRRLFDEEPLVRKHDLVGGGFRVPLVRDSFLRRDVEGGRSIRYRPFVDEREIGLNMRDVREDDLLVEYLMDILLRRQQEGRVEDLYRLLKENYGYRRPLYRELDY